MVLLKNYGVYSDFSKQDPLTFYFENTFHKLLRKAKEWLQKIKLISLTKLTVVTEK